ncbi:MAG: hypothetical protein JWO78_1344 [Micavibrio sp.]|nr:hypothetical protein [Micavibrio sp.]
MAPAPDATAFFSSAAYEEAVVNRRFHEISAFNDLADYATRGHALSLAMVREEYPKRAQKNFAPGGDYFAAVMANEVYDFLGLFAKARATGDDYAGAVRKALASPAALMTSSLYLQEGRLEDSVRHSQDHLSDRRNDSRKVCVTNDTMIEALYALQFLWMHLDQNRTIRDGSVLGIQKIQCDINDALNAGTGMENAAKDNVHTPEAMFIAMVRSWLEQQALQSLMLEKGILERMEQGVPLDGDMLEMLETGGFYRDISVCIHAVLGDSLHNGAYLAYFDAAARKAGKHQAVDPVVALHRCMSGVLKAQIEVIQSGRAEHCGPEDAPVFSAAYTALMRAVEQRFPLYKVAVVEKRPVPAMP